MKNLVFLASMLFATIVFGQNQELKEIKVIAPQFQCELFESFNALLNNNVEYPCESKNAGLQGTEVIQFKITTSGEVTDIVVINSISSEIDEEVIRIIEFTSGKWTPGLVNGKPVQMKREATVAFLLHKTNDFAEIAKNYQQKGNRWMFAKNNPKKALKYYNKAIVLLPRQESLLAMRGLCRYELGDEVGAIKDWNKIATLSSNDFNEFAHNTSEMKGYSELAEILHK